MNVADAHAERERERQQERLERIRRQKKMMAEDRTMQALKLLEKALEMDRMWVSSFPFHFLFICLFVSFSTAKRSHNIKALVWFTVSMAWSVKKDVRPSPPNIFKNRVCMTDIKNIKPFTDTTGTNSSPERRKTDKTIFKLELGTEDQTTT